MIRKNRYRPLSVRRSDRKSKQRLWFSIAIAAILIYLLVFWLLPTLAGGLFFVSKLKGSPKSTGEKIPDSTLAPPVLNIPYEATNSASIKIKGYATANTDVEIYLDDSLVSKTRASDDGTFLSENISLSLGSNNLSGKTFDNENHTSLSSKPIRLIYDNEKPALSVNSPTDGQEIKGGDKKVTVSGKVDPQDTASLIANNTRIVFNADGSFSQTLEIQEGDNQITVTASDNAGNSSSQSFKVTYHP